MEKTKLRKLLLVAVIVLIAVNFSSCSKDEGNEAPTCSITSPSNGAEIAEGTIVTISVNAEDSDGSISDVSYFVNDTKVGSVTSAPYNYDWNTNNAEIKSYTLKATASDNKDTEASDEITVSIIIATGSFTDIRDGTTYNTVKIGDQWWMSENLNYDPGNGSWAYENDPSNAAVYGRLYKWKTAVTACPDGWHLPKDNEWIEMEMFLGMSQSDADGFTFRGTDEGSKLKTTSGWDNNGNGTNSSGFSALPGGYFWQADGIFEGMGEDAMFWAPRVSDTTDTGYNAWFRNLNYDSDKVYRENLNRNNGFSVRCVKD